MENTTELEYNELIRQIENGLTEEQRKIFSDKVEGYSLKEIADNHGIKQKRVYKQFDKVKRIVTEVMELIYEKYNGRCQLCGRDILLSEMSLDHHVALSMGGIDDVSNLVATCYPCNRFKSNIESELFENRINDIFMYQMEKKAGNSLKWKIVHRLLRSCIR